MPKDKKIKRLSPEVAKMYKEAQKERKATKPSARKVGEYKPKPSPEKLKEMGKKYVPKLKTGSIKANLGKKAIKRIAKKTLVKRALGKTLTKAIPGVGTAMLAYDIAKSIPKSKMKPIKKGESCGPGQSTVTTGGKTYCVSSKIKKKFKAGKPAKDIKSKR